MCVLAVGMVVLDGYVYAVGGYDGLTRIDSVERYSPRRDAWELVAPLPVPLSRCQAAALNGYLYVAGAGPAVVLKLTEAESQLRFAVTFDPWN